MFTGIIEETGKINGIRSIAGGKSLQISASKILNDIKLGDSISINGVCLTVTKFSSKEFSVDAVGETLIKTTINSFRIGAVVNLERAMMLNQRIGGHLVQGHVTDVGQISEIKKLGENFSISVRLPKSVAKYIISEGSIAVDGISLTIAKIIGDTVTLSIIPHTWKETNLNNIKIGDNVNLEADLIAKYVEKFVANSGTNEIISEDALLKMGY